MYLVIILPHLQILMGYCAVGKEDVCGFYLMSLNIIALTNCMLYPSNSQLLNLKL